MSNYSGFDLVPRLSSGPEDTKNWAFFMSAVQGYYQNNDLVEVKQNPIVVKVDPDLILPFEGYKLLRFSSKISVSHAEGVEDYLDTITQIVEEHFGVRVHVWDQALGEGGFYTWDNVHDSRGSFEQPGELNISTAGDQRGLVVPSKKNRNTKLFSMQEVPGKGKGLVACFNVAQGKRILSDSPLMTQCSHALTTTNVNLERDIAQQVKKLSKAKQRQFLELHNNVHLSTLAK